MPKSTRLCEYSGALHVHSTYSDGSGTVSEIVSAAQAAGLDFLFLTDHNGLQAKAEGWDGWHGSLLVSVGEEVSSRHGHCLALGTTARVSHKQPLRDIIQDVAAQKGLSFVAHPHGVYRPFLKLRDHSWKDWGASGFTGLEIWSYMFDWARDLKYHRFFRHYRAPDDRIKGPLAQTLSTWDRLCQQQRVVGIGGVDAHARRYPVFPFVVFPYSDLFRTVRTHVLVPEAFRRESCEDTQALLNSLANGRCFAAYDRLADGTGARFGSSDGSLHMGDEAEFVGPVDILFEVPSEADLSVICDGDLLAKAVGRQLVVNADRPGVYRAEARINHRPWIFTNPIYLRHRAGVR